ncbi:MAG: transketolase [Rhodospirillaceae bacterium]|jgi:transketolase|nr:transketolase [Rhodospirillaceae bacterium]
MSGKQDRLEHSFAKFHREMANAIRFLAVDGVQAANSGHPGMPMGMADVATVLFSKFLKYDASSPDWIDRDRFVLSAGHGSMLLYSLLHLSGYADMSLDELKNFRQLGFRTAGHPEYGHASGIECTTGPLGQGLAMAVGMALGERLMNSRFGDELIDHHTYVIAGDGCLMEGISHEAISIAGHLKLSKLIVFFDDNSISIDGSTNLSVSDNQLQRFESCGWDVESIDGHDPDAISDSIAKAKNSKKPSMIACKTIIGMGAPNKQGTAGTHGAPLGDDEIALARKKMEWPYESFEVPQNVRDLWLQAGSQNSDKRRAWDAKYRNDALKSELEEAISGEVPNEITRILNIHKENLSREKPKIATRQASGAVLELLTDIMPGLIGGSADLTGSVNTKTSNSTPVASDNFQGSYIHYGVREFGMACVMNGLALHGGTVPYGGTFLVFADYLRGALRLSALMGLKVIYVLTHDSIGLGEDGPTHQPVETLASLRAIPNLNVLRPADSIETAECWKIAIESVGTPSAIVLTRQGLTTVRTKHSNDNLSAKGGYVLAEAAGERDVTIISTGSEVEIALEAKKSLQEIGVNAAVVSLPSWHLFDEQDTIYKEYVLGAGLRVGIEAAVEMGWNKYIGVDGEFIGMTSFGASGPASELYKHFGITSENVVKKVKARLKV